MDSDYQRLVINIKSLSLARVGVKFVIKNDLYIVPDLRFFSSLCRFITSDNRIKVLDFLNKMINDLLTILDSTTIEEEERLRLLTLIPTFHNSLHVLRITYNEDDITAFAIENLSDRLQHHLKRIKKLLRTS